MGLSTSSVILFFNMMLLCIASYILGSLLSSWLHHHVLSIPFTSPKVLNFVTDKPPSDIGIPQKEFEVILLRNIFNAQETELELTPTVALEEIIPQQSSSDDTIQQTRLSIALAGTMIYGERDSFAFISKQDSLNKYVIYILILISHYFLPNILNNHGLNK